MKETENEQIKQKQKGMKNNQKPTTAIARAGNVIGGGDWLYDRLFPDIFRAVRDFEVLKVRHPESIRPWQHVLDCLNGYLTLVNQMLFFQQMEYQNLKERTDKRIVLHQFCRQLQE